MVYLLPHAVNSKVDQTLHTLSPPFPRSGRTEVGPTAVATLGHAAGPEILLGWPLRDGVVEKPVSLPHKVVRRMRVQHVCGMSVHILW
jgi:hypothetical protein